MTANTPDDIANFDEEKFLFRAGKGTRIANYIIDSILFLTLFFLTVRRPNGLISIDRKSNTLLFLLIFIIYYMLFEYFLGKTPGKYVTGTKVVDQDGGKPSFYTLFIRTTARLIPFDNLSLLFSKSPWHDSFSETIVVNYRPAVSMKYVITIVIVSFVAVSYWNIGRTIPTQPGTIKRHEILGQWAIGQQLAVKGHPWLFDFYQDSKVYLFFGNANGMGSWSAKSTGKNEGPDIVSEVHVAYVRENVKYDIVLHVRKSKWGSYLAEGEKALYGKPGNFSRPNRHNSQHPGSQHRASQDTTPLSFSLPDVSVHASSKKAH